MNITAIGNSQYQSNKKQNVSFRAYAINDKSLVKPFEELIDNELIPIMEAVRNPFKDKFTTAERSIGNYLHDGDAEELINTHPNKYLTSDDLCEILNGTFKKVPILESFSKVLNKAKTITQKGIDLLSDEIRPAQDEVSVATMKLENARKKALNILENETIPEAVG